LRQKRDERMTRISCNEKCSRLGRTMVPCWTSNVSAVQCPVHRPCGLHSSNIHSLALARCLASRRARAGG
jgi:hypothetical protein